jgi:hypothetical protein
MEATAERNVNQSQRSRLELDVSRLQNTNGEPLRSRMVPGKIYRSRNFPGVDIINLGDRIMYTRMLNIGGRHRIFEMIVGANGKRSYNPRYCENENNPEKEFEESKEQTIEGYLRYYQSANPQEPRKAPILRNEIPAYVKVVINANEKKLMDWYKIPRTQRRSMIHGKDPFAPREVHENQGNLYNSAA